MDKSLIRWYCDVCGEPIEKVSDAYVVWGHNTKMADGGFKIIHKSRCDDNRLNASMALRDFLGVEGLNKILSMLTYGPLSGAAGQNPGVADMDEFVDLVRRVQIPYYEEARRRFGEQDVQDHWQGANEVRPYMQDALQAIIKL